MKLLKTIVKIKNKELSFQALKNNREIEMTKIRSEIKDRNKPVHENGQYEQTTVGSDAAREAYHQIVRGCTTAVTDNLETYKETPKVIRSRENKSRKMESEEARLEDISRKVRKA